MCSLSDEGRCKSNRKKEARCVASTCSILHNTFDRHHHLHALFHFEPYLPTEYSQLSWKKEFPGMTLAKNKHGRDD